MGSRKKRIIVSQNSGFCIGVKQAISRIEEALKTYPGRTIFCLGMFIHNENVVKEYAQKGLRYVSYVEDVPEGEVLLLTSHGTPQEILSKARERNLIIVDLICSYVLALQNIAKKLKNEGYDVLLFGDKQHPEIRAILDIVPEAKVIDKESILQDNLNFKINKVGVLSQTTQSTKLYSRLIKQVLERLPEKEVRVYNTICRDVVDRQKEVAEMAKLCDVMLVLGGSKSANTRRLYEIASEYSKAKHISVLDDFDCGFLQDAESVGVVSGTSTPDWFVRDIVGLIEGC